MQTFRDRLKKLPLIIEWTIFLVGLCLLAYVFICTYRGKTANLFGVNVLHIITGSMEPTISKDDYILVKKCGEGSLKEDDIIAFYSEEPNIYGRVVVHRIIKINEDGTYVTKGDANKTYDMRSIRDDQVIGRYVDRIWFLNWVKSFLDFRKLLLLLVVIPLFLISVYEFSSVTKIVYEIKKEKKEKVMKQLGMETVEEKMERLKKEAIEEYLIQQQEVEKADGVNGEKR